MRTARLALVAAALAAATPLAAQRTEKPQLHGKHWVAVTGKPLGATAGAMIFQQGGNAVDAAAAMLALWVMIAVVVPSSRLTRSSTSSTSLPVS